MRCFIRWVLSSLVVLSGIGTVVGQEQQAEQPAPVQKVISLQAIGGADGNVILSTGDGAPLTFTLGGAGGGGGWAGGMGFVPQDDLGILSQDQFHEDLALVPDQKERITTLRRDMQEKRSKLYGDIRKMEPGKIGTLVRDTEKQLMDETRQRLNEILLPHQVDRLRQVKTQLQMRSRGAGALASGELAETLGLTEKQRNDLAEKQREAEKQLREKIDEIRKQLVKDVIQDVLTAEQRDKLTKLIGDELRTKAADAQPARIRATNP